MKTRKCHLCGMVMGKQDAMDGGYWFCLSRACGYTEDPFHRDASKPPPLAPKRPAKQGKQHVLWEVK